MPKTDEGIELLHDIAKGWLATRNSIIAARDASAESAIFAANHGTHMEFINGLTAAASEVGYLVDGWTPEEVQIMGELFTSWYSTLSSGRRQTIKVVSR